MGQPIEVGAHQLHRREAAGHLGQGRTHLVIKGFGAVLPQVEVWQFAENLLNLLCELLAAGAGVAEKLTAVRHEYCPCHCCVVEACLDSS